MERNESRKPNRPEPSSAPSAGGSVDWGSVGEYAVIGFVFPLALVIGFFAGRWIGGWLGGPTAGAITGLVLGTVAAFYNLYETLRRLERREAARRTETGTEKDG